MNICNLDDIREDEPALFNSLAYILSSTTDEQLADYDISINDVSSTFTVSNRALLIRRKINLLIHPPVESSLHMIMTAFAASI